MQIASRTTFSRGRLGVGAALFVAMCASAGFAVWRNEAQVQTAPPAQKVVRPTEPEPAPVDASEPAATVLRIRRPS